MDYKIFKEYSKWLSQIFAVVSLITIVYVKSKWLFVTGSNGGFLVLISLIAAILTFIFGIVSIPRWQGFVALTIFCFVMYCILFTPLYAIS